MSVANLDVFQREGLECLGLDIAGLGSELKHRVKRTVGERQEFVILGAMDSHHTDRDVLLLVVLVERILGIENIFPLIEDLGDVNATLNLAVGELNIELGILDRGDLCVGDCSELNVIRCGRLVVGLTLLGQLSRFIIVSWSHHNALVVWNDGNNLNLNRLVLVHAKVSSDGDVSDEAGHDLAFLGLLEAGKESPVL
ncbi:hypothetical protein HG531_007401 [Fusarium graminearum]|nr:hypothetical protein HG531_007401 [Fusarium graminearum]